MTDKINERDRSRPPGLETAPSSNTLVSNPIESSRSSSPGRDNSTSSTRVDNILTRDEISSPVEHNSTSSAQDEPALKVQDEANKNTVTSQQNIVVDPVRAQRLANLRPVKKGDPPLNPRGRPKKDYDLAKMARKHAQLAVDTLARCLVDDSATWPAKVSAAGELLDRGYGRAPQSLAIDAKVDVSEAFEAFVRDLSDRRAGRKPQAQVIEHDADEAEVE